MLIILEQVFILFIFAAAGYALCKCGVVNSGHSQILSKLLVYVFLPCNIFKTFASNFTREYLSGNYETVLSSVVIIIFLGITMHYLAKVFSKDKYERSIYEYSLVIPNYGYMGYALAEALFGESGLMNIMMFAIPVSCYIYTYGFAILTKKPLSLKKLLHPVILVMVAGMFVGILQIPIPDTVMVVLKKSSACMAPVSMLLAGIVISNFNFRRLVCNKNYFIVVLLRLIVIPIILGLMLRAWGNKEALQAALLFYAMPCGLNTIVFPKLVDGNCEIGAGLAFISNILACVTIPIIFTLFKLGG